MLTFSNPRLRAEFPEWSLGGSKRGLCVFQVETTGKGSRVTKTTTGKPKKFTYARKCCIVDGSDGKTYILELSHYNEAVSIHSHDHMTPGPEVMKEHYFTKDREPETFQTLNDLINEAYSK